MLRRILIKRFLRQKREADTLGIAPPEQVNHQQVEHAQSLPEHEETAKRRKESVKGEDVPKYQPKRGENKGEKQKIAQQDDGNGFSLRNLIPKVRTDGFLHNVRIGTQAEEVLLIRACTEKANSPIQKPEGRDDEPFHGCYSFTILVTWKLQQSSPLASVFVR